MSEMSQEGGPTFFAYASVLGMAHDAHNPVRELDFFEDRIEIYELRRIKKRLVKGRFLRKASYRDVRRCHLAPPGTGTGSTLGGFVAGPTPSILEISILKFHYATENNHHQTWDEVVHTDHFIVYGDVGKGKLDEIVEWLREKIRADGGKL